MGTADRGRAPAAPAVLAAGRRLARPRPVAPAADDRGRPRPGGAHRQHPGRLRARRAVDAPALRRRVPDRLAGGRLRPVVEHALRDGHRSASATSRRWPCSTAAARSRRSAARPIGGLLVQVFGAPLAMLVDAAVLPRLGRLPAPDPVARAADRDRGGLDRANACWPACRSSFGDPIMRPTLLSVATVNLFTFAFGRAVHPVRDDRRSGVSPGALGLALGTGAVGARDRRHRRDADRSADRARAGLRARPAHLPGLAAADPARGAGDADGRSSWRCSSARSSGPGSG